MIKKHYYTWTDVERMCVSIVNQMYTDNWRPDYIVGLTRGGNVPATIISNMTGIRCEALKVSLRDDEQGPESNLWMSEDAFGYVSEDDQTVVGCRWDNMKRKKILIVDDINDTGATFNWIKEDWTSSCLPMEHDAWNNFDNVRYTCHEVNKAEEDVWLVYPWENVSEY